MNRKERTARKGQLERYIYNRTAGTVQVEWDRQNRIGRTRLPERTARKDCQDCQNRAARTGLQGKACQHRTARIRQTGQDRKERTARKEQLEQDSQ